MTKRKKRQNTNRKMRKTTQQEPSYVSMNTGYTNVKERDSNIGINDDYLDSWRHSCHITWQPSIEQKTYK